MGFLGKLLGGKSNIELLAQVNVDPVKSCCFLPDDETLAVGLESGEIQLLESPEYTIRKSFHIDGKEVTQITCSSDTNRLAVMDGDTKSIWTWELDTGEQVVELKGLMDKPNHIALSPEGDRLGVGNRFKPTIHIYELTSGDRIMELQGHNQSVIPAPFVHRVNDLEFSPDGRHLVSVGDDARAVLWDLETNTGECLMSHEYIINRVCFSHAGDWFATGGAESWMSEGSKTLVGLRELGTMENDIFAAGDTAPVYFLAYNHQDTKIVVICSDENAWLWTGDPEASRIDHDFGDVLALSPFATKVAGMVDDTLKIWSIEKLVQ